MKRIDKRENSQLRKINIKRDFITTAEGSCMIEMGNTRVVCTATVDKNVPQFLKNSGQGWVTAEYGMLPRSSNVRMTRDRHKLPGRTMEIQRLIGRSLRSVVDTKKLGERTLWVDCDVIQADGGTRTASVIGGYIAVVDCVRKLHSQGVTDGFCVYDFLGAVSVGMLKGEYILDLCFEEDSAADVDMNVVMRGSGEFIEIQGTGERASFSQEELNKLIDLARKGINEIIELEKSMFGDISPLMI